MFSFLYDLFFKMSLHNVSPADGSGDVSCDGNYANCGGRGGGGGGGW